MGQGTKRADWHDKGVTPSSACCRWNGIQDDVLAVSNHLEDNFNPFMTGERRKKRFPRPTCSESIRTASSSIFTFQTTFSPRSKAKTFHSSDLSLVYRVLCVKTPSALCATPVQHTRERANFPAKANFI
ncbi:hypothetical protein TNCV_1024881 [Trichonephila clavipes]|nr:hypothetical protein TNCV_1024881 [Trichonephila clavipes]